MCFQFQAEAALCLRPAAVPTEMQRRRLLMRQQTVKPCTAQKKQEEGKTSTRLMADSDGGRKRTGTHEGVADQDLHCSTGFHCKMKSDWTGGG
jgi:hypothetical protein